MLGEDEELELEEEEEEENRLGGIQISSAGNATKQASVGTL